MKFRYITRSKKENEKGTFICDGAGWSWTRVKPLFSDLGLAITKVVELLVFYHTMEHINALAKLKKSEITCFDKFIKTLNKHWRIILNYFNDRVTSGFEGVGFYSFPDDATPRLQCGITTRD